MALVPLRLAAFRKLTSLIEATTFAEGQNFDLTGKVYWGRPLFGHEGGDYWINIIDAPRQDPGSFAGDKQARRNAWELYVQAIVADRLGGNPTEELFWLSAGVEQQLARLSTMDAGRGKGMYPHDYRLGPGFEKHIVSVEVGPSLIRPPDPDANAHAYMFQTVVIELAGKVGEPYIDIQ